MLTLDWAQKILCIILPNPQTASPEFLFHCFLTEFKSVDHYP